MSAVETDAFSENIMLQGRRGKQPGSHRGKKSKFRRRKTDARDADFDNFDYKGR
jgi:hypothetical protein